MEYRGQRFECGDDALFRAVESVVENVNHRVYSLGDQARVLVIGSESARIASFLSHQVRFPSVVEPADLSRRSGDGVFYLESAHNLRDLPAKSFDVVLVFNWASTTLKALQLLAFHANRVLRVNGFLAGTGIFCGIEAVSGPSADIRKITTQTLHEFRSSVESSGFSVQIASDLSLEGRVRMEYSDDFKESMCLNASIQDGSIVCAKFFAIKSTASAIPSAGIGAESAEATETATTTSTGSTADKEAPTKPLTSAPRPMYHLSPTSRRVIVSGTSLGLPNSLHPDTSFFDPTNFDRVFQGVNCISQLTDGDKQDILDKNVVQVLKIDGKRVQRPLTKPSEVIQLASKLGHFDVQKEYGVPKYVVDTLDTTYQLAIAAGLEALYKANILKRDTATDGSVCFTLPEEMKATTGVIFASSFPCLDSCVQEVTQTVDAHVRSIMSGGKIENKHIYDRKLLFKLLVMANNQLAELICARGPNTHVNSACSSMTQAIAMAEDWIRLGRCERVVVISADNATSPNLLPYLGTGFLSLTAATTAPTIETGAVPFDKSRTGMILGMGAAGMVLESLPACHNRGGRPMTEIVASHFLNSAFHASLLDRKHIAEEFVRFVDGLEHRFGIDRHKLAEDCVYYSHETFTCSKGGCAKAELDALAAALGEDSKAKVLVCNTKGFTGHPMGVGIEDVVAVESLDRGLVPPIANFKELDERLGKITLSQGGTHSRKYALRFAAGFGSQFVYVLYRKWDESCERELGAAEEVIELAPKTKLSCAVDDSSDSGDEDLAKKEIYAQPQAGAGSRNRGSFREALSVLDGSEGGSSRNPHVDLDIDDACSVM